jgi:ketosteroid isomerase-like protein
MSRENVEMVRRLYDAVASRDVATVLALYDPEVEVAGGAGSPDERLTGRPGVYRGHEGLRRLFNEYYDAWETVEDDCEELIDAGEQVISVVTSRARGRVSGLEFEWHPVGVWTIREGKIVRSEWFQSREEALEAAGVRD